MIKTKICLLALLTNLLAGLATPAYAWDSYGHMMVAAVAYQQLTAQAKLRANALIQLNPKFNQWSNWIPSTISQADKDEMIFMIAATWADEIKSAGNYTSDGSHNGNRPETSPDPSGNHGYTDLLMHKYWHFIDTPFTKDGSPLKPVPDPNAQERIALFRGILASNSSDDLKSYDLVWLLHLVGDVHQPLHCVTRISSTQLEGDDGGNGEKVTKLDNTQVSFHKYWDDLLGTGSETDIAVVQSAMASASSLPKANKMVAPKSSELFWIAESVQIAKNDVYKSPIGAGTGPFTITPKYEKSAISIAKTRIALAGTRLANLINSELK